MVLSGFIDTLRSSYTSPTPADTVEDVGKGPIGEHVRTQLVLTAYSPYILQEGVTMAGSDAKDAGETIIDTTTNVGGEVTDTLKVMRYLLVAIVIGFFVYAVSRLFDSTNAVGG